MYAAANVARESTRVFFSNPLHPPKDMKGSKDFGSFISYLRRLEGFFECSDLHGSLGACIILG